MTEVFDPSPAKRRVSVVVPTCNRPHLLPRALSSIRALEGPDLAFEIIVGDNGDLAENARIAAEFGARYVKASRPGASEARNAAMAQATGDYIAFLDDDDVWLPGHIRPHLAMLEARPDLDGVIAQARRVDMSLKPLGLPLLPDRHPGEAEDLLRTMLSGFFPQIGTVVVRAHVRRTYGYFDPELIGGEDLDWQLRIASVHALGYIAEPVILFATRKLGDFDALQRLRVGYDRKVFLRHARAMPHLWRSGSEYRRAYAGTLRHFYDYFTHVAVLSAERGDHRRALAAIGTALSIFRLRGAKHLFTPSPLRNAMRKVVMGWPRPFRASFSMILAVLLTACGEFGV